ncbi:hypothetical protein MFC_01445 [Mesomycoplasma flocculare ATCC 27716]|nr:hypothetical protein MFC_01445 [Mesomycoplasma flocculare ATCC 27716]
MSNLTFKNAFLVKSLVSCKNHLYFSAFSIILAEPKKKKELSNDWIKSGQTRIQRNKKSGIQGGTGRWSVYESQIVIP